MKEKLNAENEGIMGIEVDKADNSINFIHLNNSENIHRINGDILESLKNFSSDLNGFVELLICDIEVILYDMTF